MVPGEGSPAARRHGAGTKGGIISGGGRPVVVVSNRVPALEVFAPAEGGASRSVGGLVSALEPALSEYGGVWLGWSGRTVRRRDEGIHEEKIGRIRLVTLDMTQEELNGYYLGFCNRALWPLFHCFPERVCFEAGHYRLYQRQNRRFARTLLPLLAPQALVWVHDYHLFSLGHYLRESGWGGPIGFFLHIPFPPPELFSMLPSAEELLGHLDEYDLIGFHTRHYCNNYVASRKFVAGKRKGREKVRAYPIGIEPELFESYSSAAEGRKQAEKLRESFGGCRIILGVDRLDYTKGIAHRLRAFEELLLHYPSWRRRVVFVQISAPSRTQVPEYRQLKREVDELVGQINGRFSDPNWVPVRYLYRSYSQQELAGLYRAADLCFVSPLRDGMNLVAKEFVAAQPPEDPGVLMLSRFCGAAEELREALLVNPYDLRGTARTLNRALRMSLRQRQRRWKALLHRVRTTTARRWRDRFLNDLARCG